MGWLAAKFNRLGSFSWSACDYNRREQDIDIASCSESSLFYIAFKLSTLTRTQARSDAKRVFKKLAAASSAADRYRSARTRPGAAL